LTWQETARLQTRFRTIPELDCDFLLPPKEGKGQDEGASIRLWFPKTKFDLQWYRQGVTFRMVEKLINELETKIRNADFSNTAHKNDLLQSVTHLKAELAAREKQSLAPLKSSVEELRSSVEGFEQSHPKLIEVVNRISSSLANLGI
jgi:hypothetical protein